MEPFLPGSTVSKGTKTSEREIGSLGRMVGELEPMLSVSAHDSWEVGTRRVGLGDKILPVEPTATVPLKRSFSVLSAVIVLIVDVAVVVARLLTTDGVGLEDLHRIMKYANMIYL